MNPYLTPEMIPRAELEESLVGLADEAVECIEKFSWCSAVTEVYFALGFEKIALFLIEIKPRDRDVDDVMWVVVGDVPPLYLDCPDVPTDVEALEAYSLLFLEWAKSVKEGLPLDDLPPVTDRTGATELEPTKELADMIESRMHFLRRHFLEALEA